MGSLPLAPYILMEGNKSRNTCRLYDGQVKYMSL